MTVLYLYSANNKRIYYQGKPIDTLRSGNESTAGGGGGGGVGPIRRLTASLTWKTADLDHVYKFNSWSSGCMGTRPQVQLVWMVRLDHLVLYIYSATWGAWTLDIYAC